MIQFSFLLSLSPSDYSSMMRLCTRTSFLSWLILTSNTMSTILAFSRSGTMSSYPPSGHQKLTKKVVIKRISDDTSYQHYHYPQQNTNHTNATSSLPLSAKEVPDTHMISNDIPQMKQPKSDVNRIFYNWFPDTMARVDSLVTISVPIPFCQFENSPCKI